MITEQKERFDGSCVFLPKARVPFRQSCLTALDFSVITFSPWWFRPMCNKLLWFGFFSCSSEPFVAASRCFSFSYTFHILYRHFTKPFRLPYLFQVCYFFLSGTLNSVFQSTVLPVPCTEPIQVIPNMSFLKNGGRIGHLGSSIRIY